MKRLFLISLVLSNMVLAEGPTDLKKGDQAPYAGTLFSTEDEKKLRQMREDSEYFKKKAELLSIDNKFLEDKSSLWMNQSKELSKQLVSSQNDSFWKKAAFFALGVAATVGAAYAVKGATK